MKWRRILPLAGFVALTALLAVGLKLDPREVPSPLINRPAPDFSLPRLDRPGAQIARIDFGNQPTLLNVWASWCSGCRAEHPVLLDLAARGDVNLIGLDYKDQSADALALLARYGNPYSAIAFDGDGRTGIDYGAYGVPETFVIDRRGMIRHKHTGPLTEEAVRETILPLLERLRNEPSV